MSNMQHANDVVMLEEMKQRANQLFNEKQYLEAAQLYTDCINGCDSSLDGLLVSVLYSNRAACNLNLDRLEEACNDCDLAIKYNSDNQKAIYRKCLSLKAMERYEAAFVLAEQLLQSKPKSAVYIELMKSLTLLLYQTRERLSDPLRIAEELCEKIEAHPPTSVNSVGDMFEGENFQKLYSLCSDRNIQKIVVNSGGSSQRFDLVDKLVQWLQPKYHSTSLVILALNCLQKIISNFSAGDQMEFVTFLSRYISVDCCRKLFVYSEISPSHDKLFNSILNFVSQIIIKLTEFKHENNVIDMLFDYLEVWMFDDCLDRCYFDVEKVKRFSSYTVNIVKSFDGKVELIERACRLKYHLRYLKFCIDFTEIAVFQSTNENQQVNLKQSILLVLESCALLMATFESTLFKHKPIESKSEFVEQLKNELTDVNGSPLKVIAGRFIVVKSMPKLYEDFLIDDGAQLLASIHSYLLDNKTIGDQPMFAVPMHLIIDCLIVVIGMKRLFQAIIKLPLFDQVYSQLSLIFQSKRSLADMLKLRILIVLVKLDIAKWQYSDQGVNVDQLRSYYNDFVEATDFLNDFSGNVQSANCQSIDFNTLSDSVEFMAYVSLQPDLKEVIVRDKNTFQKLLLITKICASTPLTPKSVDHRNHFRLECCFFVLKTLQNLTNATIEHKPDSNEGEISKKEMKKLAKSTGSALPQKHKFDKKTYKTERIRLLSSQPLIFTLMYNIHECMKLFAICTPTTNVVSTNLQTSSPLTNSSVYPTMAKLLQVLLWNQDCRGVAIQSGCVPILLFICTKYLLNTGDINSRDKQQQLAHHTVLFAANALARIVITNNPAFVFTNDTMHEAIRPLLYLTKNRCVDFSNDGGLWCYEGLLALTNILSVSDATRKHFFAIDYSYHTLETLMFDENEKIVTSAIECASNLFISSEIVYSHFIPGGDNCVEDRKSVEERLRKFVVFAGNTDSLAISIASASALIHLCQYRAITLFYLGLDNFFPLIDLLLSSSNGDLMYRCAVLVYVILNVITADEVKSFKVTEAPFFEILLKLEALKDSIKSTIPNIDPFLDYLDRIMNYCLSNNLIELQ